MQEKHSGLIRIAWVGGSIPQVGRSCGYSSETKPLIPPNVSWIVMLAQHLSTVSVRKDVKIRMVGALIQPNFKCISVMGL